MQIVVVSSSSNLTTCVTNFVKKERLYFALSGNLYFMHVLCSSDVSCLSY